MTEGDAKLVEALHLMREGVQAVYNRLVELADPHSPAEAHAGAIAAIQVAFAGVLHEFETGRLPSDPVN